jgi:nucleotide-binding universal stress UspA family protein
MATTRSTSAFRHIVVPLDDSDFSRAALPYALALASEPDAALELVSAVDPAWALSGLGYGGNLAAGAPGYGSGAAVHGHGRELLDATRKRWGAELEELAGEIRARTPATVRWEVLDGVAADAVAEWVGSTGADLVVMSTHGRGGLKRAWLGSVADRLVRHLSVPLLLVRPGGAEGSADGVEPDAGDAGAVGIRRILVPLDGSRLGEGALGPATRLAKQLGAEILPLQVVDPAEDIAAAYEGYATERRAEARRYLADVVERLRAEGVAVADGEVQEGVAASTILERAREGVDLVAMATQGRGGFKRWILGSVSDKVLRGGDRPVLLVRPDDEGSPERQKG